MTTGLKSYMPKQNIEIEEIGTVSIKLSPSEDKTYFYLTQPLFTFTSNYGIELNMLISVANGTISVKFPYESTIRKINKDYILKRYDGAKIAYKETESAKFVCEEGYSNLVCKEDAFLITTENNDQYVFALNGILKEIRVNSTNESITSITRGNQEVQISNNKNKDVVKIVKKTSQIEVQVYRNAIMIKKYQIRTANNELIIQGYNTYKDGSQNQILKENIKTSQTKITIIQTKQYITKEYDFSLNSDGTIKKYEDKVGNEITFSYFQNYTNITQNYLLAYQNITICYDEEAKIIQIVDEGKEKFILYRYNEKKVVNQQSQPFYYHDISKNENLTGAATTVTKNKKSYVSEFDIRGNSNDIYTIYINCSENNFPKKITCTMGYKKISGQTITLEVQEQTILDYPKQFILITNIIPEEYQSILLVIEAEDELTSLKDVELYQAGFVNKINYNQDGMIDSILQENHIQTQIIENKKVIRTTYDEIEYEGNYIKKIKDVNGIEKTYEYAESEEKMINPNIKSQTVRYQNNVQKINYEYDEYNRITKIQNAKQRYVSEDYKYELNSSIKEIEHAITIGYQKVSYEYPVASQPFYSTINFTSQLKKITTTKSRNFSYTNEVITNISGDSNITISYNSNNNLRQIMYYNNVYISYTYAKKENKTTSKTTNLIKTKMFGGNGDNFIYEYDENFTKILNIQYATSFNNPYQTLLVSYEYEIDKPTNIKEITCYSMSEMGPIVTYITYEYTNNDEIYQIQTNIQESENNQKRVITYASGDIVLSETNCLAIKQESKSHITQKIFINDVRNSLRNIKACDFDITHEIELSKLKIDIPQPSVVVESKAILSNHLIPLDYMNYNDGSLQSYAGLSLNENEYSTEYEPQKIENVDGFESMFLTDVLNPENPNSNKKKFEIYSYNLFYVFDNNNSPFDINNSTLSFSIKFINQSIHDTIIARLCEELPLPEKNQHGNQLINLENDIFLLYQHKKQKIIFSLYRGSIMKPFAHSKEQLNFEIENRLCYIEFDYDATIWYTIGINLENGIVKLFVNHKMSIAQINFYENSVTQRIPQYFNGIVFGLRTPHTTNNNYDTHFEAEFYISNILIAYRQSLSDIEMKNIYNTSLEILKENSTDFAFQTITTSFDQINLSNLTYISFNKNLISNNNLRPKLNLLKSALDINDLYFKYDYELSKYVFISFKEELIYETYKKVNNQDLFITFKVKRIVYNENCNESNYFDLFYLDIMGKTYLLKCNIKGQLRLYIDGSEKSIINTEIITENYQNIYISIHEGKINIAVEDTILLSNESIKKFNGNEEYIFSFGNNDIQIRNNLVFAYSDLYLTEQFVNDEEKQKLKLNHGYLKNYYDYQGNVAISTILKDANTSLLQRQTAYDYSLNQIKSVSLIGPGIISAYNYEYNDYGNVTSISNILHQNICKYEYDENQQLISETKGNVITKYTYDNKGNITSIINGNEEKKFEYDTQNRLSKVNDDEIIYNAETNLFLESIGKQKFTWVGNYLSEINQDNTTIAFEYDNNGRRILKGENGRLHYYFYQNNLLIHEIVQNYASKENEHEIYYIYDENQQIFAIIYDKKKYYYLKDGLNNIIGLLDENGNVVANYEYSAYGEVTTYKADGSIDTLTSSIGNLNPIRYKGYYYDVETNFYWLTTRYYNPKWGRFISPDSIDYLDSESINGLNLYCYCGNDPVNYYDPSGHFTLTATALVWIAFGVSALVGAGASVISQGFATDWQDINLLQVIWDAGIAGIGGALSMSSLGWGAMIAANTALGFVGSIGGHLIQGHDLFSANAIEYWTDIGISTLIGLGIGVIGGAGAQHGMDLKALQQNFISAYDNMLATSTKVASGYYKTTGMAVIHMNKATARYSAAFLMYGSAYAKMLSSITWSIYKSSVVTLGMSWRTAIM